MSSKASPPNSSRSAITEVRYSLADLREEIKAERSASTFSMEKLDQHEIGKLFKGKAPRAKRKK